MRRHKLLRKNNTQVKIVCNFKNRLNKERDIKPTNKIGLLVIKLMIEQNYISLSKYMINRFR